MRNNLSMIEKELPSTKERKQCFVGKYEFAKTK
jgi:hypothetical protein